MPWYIVIQIIALAIQFVFLAGTIYSGTKKGREKICDFFFHNGKPKNVIIPSEEEKIVERFRRICLNGNLVCMCIVLFMNVFAF